MSQNQMVKISSMGNLKFTGDDDNAEVIFLTFKCAERDSTDKRAFTVAELMPLVRQMRYNDVWDLKRFIFGVSPTTRESDGFQAVLEGARAAMTPLEALLGRASNTLGNIAATDFTDPRSLQKMATQLFSEDGILGPVAQLLKNMPKPQPPTNGTPTA